MFVEKLYLDKINAEDRGFRRDPRINNCMVKVNALEDELIKSLDDDNRALLLNFMEAFTELSAYTVSEAYAIGFRQGSQFTYQTLNEEESQ